MPNPQNADNGIVEAVRNPVPMYVLLSTGGPYNFVLLYYYCFTCLIISSWLMYSPFSNSASASFNSLLYSSISIPCAYWLRLPTKVLINCKMLCFSASFNCKIYSCNSCSTVIVIKAVCNKFILTWPVSPTTDRTDKNLCIKFTYSVFAAKTGRLSLFL